MRIFIAVLAMSLIGACTPAPPPIAMPQAEPPPPAVEVAAACSGGFSGGGNGVTITADDHIIRWAQATAGAQRTETDLGPNAALAADVRARLTSIGFANIAFNEPGNMTCSLRAGDHSVVWPQGDANAPASVLGIHALVLSADGDAGQ